MIVGTQTDLRDDPGVREKLAKQKMSPVRKEDGERMAKELGAVKYVECSALTQYKLKDVFDEVSDSRSRPEINTPNPSKMLIVLRLSLQRSSHQLQRRSRTSASSCKLDRILPVLAASIAIGRAACRSHRHDSQDKFNVYFSTTFRYPQSSRPQSTQNST